MKSLRRVRKTKTVTQRVYQQLERAVSQNELLPGAQLVADNLAQQLNVSRTPVREALLILEREGLVEVLDGKGTFVKGLEVQDLLEIFGFREAIELYSLAHVVARASHEDLIHVRAELVRAQEPRTLTEAAAAADADLDFHRWLVGFTCNKMMIQTWDHLGIQLRRFWVDGQTAPGRAGADIIECLMVVDSAIQRDVGTATAALKRHLESTRQALVAWREQVYEGT